MNDKPQLFVEFESVEHLREQMSENLLRGRAYVTGEYHLEPREECDLILIHPQSGEWMPLAAEVVYLSGDSAPGVGLELSSDLQLLAERLHQFAQPAEESATARSSEGFILESVPIEERTSLVPSDRQAVPAQSAAEKVRGLNAAGRDRIARRGTLAERVALERAYGAAVWESLLANPLLSTAEVARIAKNHTASQPILVLIASSSAWLVKPEVRRALLSNPRLPEGQIDRTLKALPSSELKLVIKQAAYPMKVRNAAKKLLGV